MLGSVADSKIVVPSVPSRVLGCGADELSSLGTGVWKDIAPSEEIGPACGARSGDGRDFEKCYIQTLPRLGAFPWDEHKRRAVSMTRTTHRDSEFSRGRVLPRSICRWHGGDWAAKWKKKIRGYIGGLSSNNFLGGKRAV